MEKLTNLLKKPASLIGKIKSIVSTINNAIWQRVAQFNVAQKLYLMSLLIIIFTAPDINWGLICGLVLMGLGLEFWPRFTVIWHSLLGKSCLLFIYAIVANFSLASAASVINDITGVGAQHLPYSHNFAILLYLPIWLIGFTFVALLILQILSPIYILIILLLKPFGVRAVKTITQSSFPVLTTILRMGLSLIVLSQLILYNEQDFMSFSHKLNQSIEPFVTAQQSKEDIDVEPVALLAANLGNNEIMQPVTETSATRKTFKGGLLDVFGENSDTELIEENAKSSPYYQRFIMHSLNAFIFILEADSLSRCEVKGDVRVVEINDYEMLEVTPDHTQEFGYRYEVKPCNSVGVSQLKSLNVN